MIENLNELFCESGIGEGCAVMKRWNRVLWNREGNSRNGMVALGRKQLLEGMRDFSTWWNAGGNGLAKRGRCMTRLEADNLGVKLRKWCRRSIVCLAGIPSCVCKRETSFLCEGFRRDLWLSVSVPLQRKESNFSNCERDCRGLAPPPLPSVFGMRCPQHLCDVLWARSSLTRIRFSKLPACNGVLDSCLYFSVGSGFTEGRG